MCGRYVISSDPSRYADYFGADEVRTESLDENYNVAPTDPVYAVAEHEGARLLGRFRWGLIPHWAKDAKKIHINARGETVATKPLFRDAFRHKRCLLPADGFYEWEPKERGRIPHYIYRRNGRPMGFAGVWSSWKDPETGEWVRTCAIITTAANDAIRSIHARMPVILPEDRWDVWLDRSNEDVTELATLLVPFTAEDTAEHAVSTLVNSVRNNLPENIVPLPPRPDST
jgi:putative SOS response-associated peptidase YedK